MEQGRQVHFFCPPNRIDIAIQTGSNAYFFLRNREKELNLYNLFHNSCQDSILTQSSFHPITHIDFHFISEVRSKVAFTTSILTDDRFDTLSLPDDSNSSQYSIDHLKRNSNDCCGRIFSSEIYIELNENNFFISNLKTNTSCKYVYNMNSYRLFDPLETGFLTDNFLSSIDNAILENIKYENGYCICNITDFRFQPQIHKRMKLRISQKSLIKFFNSILTSKSKLLSFLSTTNNYRETNESKNDESEHKNINITEEDLNEIKVETEKQILLKLHPIICTDPSPDFARVQSIIDFRKKMWRQNTQGQINENSSSSKFSNLSQKQNYPKDKRSIFGGILPVGETMAKVEKQIDLPKSFQLFFPINDSTQNRQQHQPPK